MFHESLIENYAFLCCRWLLCHGCFIIMSQCCQLFSGTQKFITVRTIGISCVSGLRTGCFLSVLHGCMHMVIGIHFTKSFAKNTPTVVATNFCATALMEAYEITKEQKYLDIALSSARFVIEDLHRSKQQEGFLFSYSPLPGNDTVYNASLLGSRLLSFCYKYTCDDVGKCYVCSE